MEEKTTHITLGEFARAMEFNGISYDAVLDIIDDQGRWYSVTGFMAALDTADGVDHIVFTTSDHESVD